MRGKYSGGGRSGTSSKIHDNTPWGSFVTTSQSFLFLDGAIDDDDNCDYNGNGDGDDGSDDDTIINYQ